MVSHNNKNNKDLDSPELVSSIQANVPDPDLMNFLPQKSGLIHENLLTLKLGRMFKKSLIVDEETLNFYIEGLDTLNF